MHEQTADDDAEKMLLDILETLRGYKEHRVAEGDPDAPLIPRVGIHRGGQQVASILAQPHRDAVADALFMSIIAFWGDAAVVTFDGWKVDEPTHPETGQAWDQESMAAYIEAHGRNNGVVIEQLTASLFTAAGQRIGGSLSYDIHEADCGVATITWGATEVFRSDYTAEGSGLIPRTAQEAFDLVSSHPDALVELRKEWADMTDAAFYAHLDCSATRSLSQTSAVAAVLIECDERDQERRSIIEERLREMGTPSGTDTRMQAAPWN